MNIYIMQKAAKAAGMYKELSIPLDPRVNLLFCWDVAWMPSKKNGPNDVILMKNKKTDFTVVIADVTEIDDENLKSVIKDGLINGLKVLDIDQKYIDNYLEKSGPFEYGLINEYKIITRLKTIDHFLWSGIEYERKKDPDLKLNNLTSQERAELSNKLIPYCLHNWGREKNGSYGDVDINQMRKALIDLKEKGPEKGEKAYELLITLDLEKYKATRRIIIPADLSFYHLHLIIQAAFEWNNAHEYEFRFSGSTRKGFPEKLALNKHPELYEPAISLNVFRVGDIIENYSKLTYQYDFYSCWEHEIVLLNVYNEYTGEKPFLLEANKSRPPENIGGVWDFVNFYEALSDPNNHEYRLKGNWTHPWKEELTKSHRVPHKLYPQDYEKTFHINS